MVSGSGRSKSILGGPYTLEVCCTIARFDSDKEISNASLRKLSDIDGASLSRLLKKLAKLGHLRRLGNGRFERVDDGFWAVMLDLESVWDRLEDVDVDAISD